MFFSLTYQTISDVKKISAPPGFAYQEENPYKEYIKEIISKYKTDRSLKIPALVLKDVQKILGPSANLVLAGNQEDNGLSVKKSTSKSKSKSRTYSTKAQSLFHPGFLNPAASPQYSPRASPKYSLSPKKSQKHKYGSPEQFRSSKFKSASLPSGFLTAFQNLKVE